ncbi:MAG TPA: hypothetical protein VM925_30935 [Labilithrix sp.]|nr:hypothetical protein [Labilithrix sp.]
MPRPASVAKVVGAVVLAAVVSSTSSCEPIEPRPRTTAPVNACPCDKYEPGKTAAACSNGRCEIATGGRPDFPFWIVVHVPNTSSSAPGLTDVLYSDEQGKPAFNDVLDPGVTKRCRPRPPVCLSIGRVANVTGRYRVSSIAATNVGFPLPENTAIPAQVVFEPIGDEQATAFPLLPLEKLYGSSQIAVKEPFSRRALPEGKYRRIFFPQPPFDEVFPPRVDERVIVPLSEDGQVDPALPRDSFEFRDEFELPDVDDVEPRMVEITREDGLDGWRAWFVDRPSQRRISVLRRLEGTSAKVPLFTTNEPLTGSTDRIEAVVAPPESWTAVPRFVTLLFRGAGLHLAYPRIPPPVIVTGVVAQPTGGGVLLGYPATVSFESEEIATMTDASRLLTYSTTVSTDDRGRFATVLPPGEYAATIEPAEGTGYAKSKQRVTVDRTVTALNLQSPLRTIVRGRAVLTDGRPLTEADVIAIPNVLPGPQPGGQIVEPRPSRTRTVEDGRFAFELDPGPYVLSVIPKAGTGFPRVVVRAEVPSTLTAAETELPEVRIPAPTLLAFKLRDSTFTENPVTNAVVRIFATPTSPPGAIPVEIGNAMTDANGDVEILLAQQRP